ncbi:MAG: DUF4926 domain-containing protein [Rhizobacter sp.]|nr:DUF4926 domain-containing protein [Chlorobiales bacterium]
MNKEIKLLGVVALTEEMEATSLDSGKQVRLKKGQVGVVVDEYADGQAFEVEFVDHKQGEHVLASVASEKLFRLHYSLSEQSETTP